MLASRMSKPHTLASPEARRQEAGEDLHQGALARTVGPQEAHHFTVADLEGDIVQRLLGTVEFGDVADGDGHTCSAEAVDEFLGLAQAKVQRSGDQLVMD
jgi:hypothetical protein